MIPLVSIPHPYACLEFTVLIVVLNSIVAENLKRIGRLTLLTFLLLLRTSKAFNTCLECGEFCLLWIYDCSLTTDVCHAEGLRNLSIKHTAWFLQCSYRFRRSNRIVTFEFIRKEKRSGDYAYIVVLWNDWNGCQLPCLLNFNGHKIWTPCVIDYQN